MNEMSIFTSFRVPLLLNDFFFPVHDVYLSEELIDYFGGQMLQEQLKNHPSNQEPVVQ